MSSMSSSTVGTIWHLSGPMDEGVILSTFHDSLISARREQHFHRGYPDLTITEIRVKTVTGYQAGFLHTLNFGNPTK